MITNSTALQDLYDIAINTISELNSGETFIVKDLFRGFEWTRISIGDRIKLGSMVLAYANRDGLEQIDICGKSSQNQQVYRKK